jgi:hypothetical protein
MSLYIPKRLLENVCRPGPSLLVTPFPGLVTDRVTVLAGVSGGEGTGASRQKGMSGPGGKRRNQGGWQQWERRGKGAVFWL